jgi:hypothetical protein
MAKLPRLLLFERAVGAVMFSKLIKLAGQVFYPKPVITDEEIRLRQQALKLQSQKKLLLQQQKKRQELIDKTQDLFAMDWTLAITRGVVTGVTVPVFTTPLIRVENNIKLGVNEAFKQMRQNPWKGYGLIAVTNAIRSCILFGVSPSAREYYKQYSWNPTATKVMALATAGLIEGVCMSFRFPLIQILHTTDAASPIDIVKKMPMKELRQRWWISCKYGMARDLLFWTPYALMVDTIEKQLRVNRQEETVFKIVEEFGIGWLAAKFALPFSYPFYRLTRDRLAHKVDGKVDLSLTMRQDFSRAWKQTPNAVDMIKHTYRGLPMAMTILPVSMGVWNVTKHVVDVKYKDYLEGNLGFFKQMLPAQSEHESKKAYAALHYLNTKFGSC